MSSQMDVTKSFPLGSANVSYKGVDLGHTDPSTKVSFKGEYVFAEAGKFGKTKVGAFKNGVEAKVELVLIQTQLNEIQGNSVGAPYSIFTPVTDAGETKLGFGEYGGKRITPGELILTSVIAENTPGLDFTMHQAVPVGDPELMYTGEKTQAWKVVFEGLIDEGQLDGQLMGSIGDNSITQDAVVPVVSSVVPANNATGVNIATAVVWTMSKALNSNTVNTESVKLIKVPGVSANSEVDGTVVLVNNGASTTITFTPASALTAATKYVMLLTEEIQDKSGNALVPDARQFTTA